MSLEVRQVLYAEERVQTTDRARPVLVYDGECAFCARCVRLLQRVGPDADVVARQVADLAAFGLTDEQVTDSVQWVQADGDVRSGHEAIAAMLITAGGIWQLIGRVALLPGISWMAAKLYRLVADNRRRFPGSAPACAVVAKSDRPPE